MSESTNTIDKFFDQRWEKSQLNVINNCDRLQKFFSSCSYSYFKPSKLCSLLKRKLKVSAIKIPHRPSLVFNFRSLRVGHHASKQRRVLHKITISVRMLCGVHVIEETQTYAMDPDDFFFNLHDLRKTLFVTRIDDAAAVSSSFADLTD